MVETGQVTARAVEQVENPPREIVNRDGPLRDVRQRPPEQGRVRLAAERNVSDVGHLIQQELFLRIVAGGVK